MIRILSGVIVAMLLALSWQTVRLSKARTAHAETRVIHADTLRGLADLTAKAANAARAAERAQVQTLAAIDSNYQQERANAQLAHDRVIAGLRAGTVQLQNRWAGCEAAPVVSGRTAAPGRADEGARDREASAGRIVQAAAECDAQVIGLQQAVRAYVGANDE